MHLIFVDVHATPESDRRIGSVITVHCLAGLRDLESTDGEE
jgi:hypothetical protein